MFIDELFLLTTIDKSIKYRGMGTLPSQHAEQLYKAIDFMLRKCNSAGFIIKMNHAERQFEILLEEAKYELDVTLNIAVIKERIYDIEQNNKTLEERIRAEYYCLP